MVDVLTIYYMVLLLSNQLANLEELIYSNDFGFQIFL